MLGKGLLKVALTPAIEGIELVADQVSVVVGLGQALHGDAAELLPRFQSVVSSFVTGV